MHKYRRYKMEELLRGDAGSELQEFAFVFCRDYRDTITPGEEREFRKLQQQERGGSTAALRAEDPERERHRLRLELLKRIR